MFPFPKSARLLKSHEYRKVCLKGTLFTGKYITLHLLSLNNKEDESIKNKLGISVSRHFGKAHIRNKFKRHIREIFRHSITQNSLCIHVKPRPFAKSATFQEIAADYKTLISKIDLSRS